MSVMVTVPMAEDCRPGFAATPSETLSYRSTVGSTALMSLSSCIVSSLSWCAICSVAGAVVMEEQ